MHFTAKGKKKGLKMKYDLDEMDKKGSMYTGNVKPDGLKQYKVRSYIP